MDDRNEEVFRQYDIKIYNMYRARGAFILETNQGLKLYKGFEGSKTHLEYENKMKENLSNKGYKNIDLYMRNKANELITEDGTGAKHIIKNWFQGEECNLRDMNDVARTVGNLAVLHNYLENNQYTGEENKYYMQNNFVDTFEKHNRELRRVRSYVRDKKQKNEFEVCFLNAFERFYEQGERAIHIIKESGYLSLLGESVVKQAICHGNYTYHNVILLKEDIATTNFEKACIGIQVADLYQFLRKTMEKNDWNPRYGQTIIEEYNRKRKLSKEEFHMLYVLLLYPEKFWKITNFYYNGKKSWIPQRNIIKLKSIEAQNEPKNLFLGFVEEYSR